MSPLRTPQAAATPGGGRVSLHRPTRAEGPLPAVRQWQVWTAPGILQASPMNPGRFMLGPSTTQEGR